MNLELILIITINIFFVLILTVGFLVGLSRGVKRSFLHLSTSVVAAIIALFTTAPITSAILKIGLSATESINDRVLSWITSLFPDLQTAMLVSPSTEAFVKSLPAVVLGIAIFIVLLFIYRFVGYIIAKIIEHCCLKSKKKEKELGLKRNRWAGGGIGFVKAFAFALLTFAPLTAFVGILNDLENQSSSAYTSSQISTEKKNGVLNQYLPAEAITAIDTYSNKTAFGIVGGLFGWDNWVFDRIATVKVDNSKISVRSELSTYIALYNTFSEASSSLSSSPNESLKENMDWDKLDKLMDSAINGPLFKEVIANLLGDIMKNISSFQFVSSFPQEVQDILTAIGTDLQDKIATIYFTNDLKNVYLSFSNLGRSGILDEFINNNAATTKLENIFTEENKEALSSSILALFDLNTLRGASEPILDYVFNTVELALANSNLGSPDTSVDNWDLLKADVKSIIENAVSLIDGKNVIAIANKPESVLEMNNEELSSTLSLLGNTLDKINGLEILQCTAEDSTNQTVLDKLLNHFGYSDIKVVDGLETGKEINSYSDLLAFLNKPLEKALSLDLSNLIKNNASYNDIILQIAAKLAEDSTEEAVSTKLEDILLPLYQSKFIRTNLIQKQLLPAIANIEVINLAALEVGSGDEYNFEASFENWKGDLKNLSRALIALNNHKDGNKTLLEVILNGGDASKIINALTDEAVDEIFPPLLYAKSLSNIRNQVFEKIAEAINSYTGKNTTITADVSTFIEGNTNDQATEVCQIIKAFLTLLPAEGENLELSDLTLAKPALVALQANAARKLADSTKNEGIFKQLYLDVYEKFSADYSDNILKGKDPLTIDYESLFGLVEKLTDKSNVFGSALSQFIENNVISADSLSTLLDTITTDVEASANEILDLVKVFNYTIDLSSLSEKDKAAVSQTVDDKDLTDGTKAKIKTLLGL